MSHTSFQLDRRQFLKAGLGAAGALAFSPGFLARALAAGKTTIGSSPYGPLGKFDANGIALPAGFSSREIARGASIVPGTAYPWHQGTDGQATFATLGPGGAPDGGWILVANSEVPLPALGGVSGIEFTADGTIERAYRVLAGTFTNCAGGPTPWGKWLSCEEHAQGMVYECDPTTVNAPAAVARPALGVFTHEAACVDPVNEHVYLTEDVGDGCLYRFTPANYPDLSAGLLEVAIVDASSKVSWAQVPNPQGGAANPTRNQVPGATRFDGGEGLWFDDGLVYFTTKGDDRVWAYHVETSLLEILYDGPSLGPDAPLSGVDNITVSHSGDIYVCEDRRDHDLCIITPDFEVSRFLKLDPVKHSGPPDGNPVEGNELVGVVFSPDGSRMYFGAQRSFGVAGVEHDPAGVVYEISGPFRQGPNGSGDGGSSGSGGGSSGSGGGGGGATRGRGPGLAIDVRPRKHIKKFLRTGISVGLQLDQPVGVNATLRAPPVGGEARDSKRPRRGAVLARGASPVALRDAAALRLKPTKAAAKLLRNRRKVTARLEVVATNGAGLSTNVSREVTLDRAKPNRAR